MPIPLITEGLVVTGLKIISSIDSEYSYELLSTKPKKGDVIAVSRIVYLHFGIYLGKSKVIHFASMSGDFGSDICVHEASLASFTSGSECLVAEFYANEENGLLYGPDETIRRAKSQIGEQGYNLIFNNCEHFATWCKTGKSKSEQVEKFFKKTILPAPGAINIFSMFLEFGKEWGKTKREIAKYEAIKNVLITDINRKYYFYEKLFKSVFDERKIAINKNFEIIDKGIKDNNNELVLAGLSGLSTIVASSPFANIGELRNLVESNKMIEM